MPAPENILAKVKLLLNLKGSPNPHEAEAAQGMVDRLVAKYNITPEELASIADKKPLYGDDDKLYATIGLVSWKQRLATVIAKQLFCHIVQEELVPLDGLHHFCYFVYGEPEDAVNVKFVFHTFVTKVEELIKKKCVGRGEIFVSSYTEGVVEAISNNIYWEGIDIPSIKSSRKIQEVQQEKILNNGGSLLAVHKEEKEKPVEQTINVNSQSLIKDVGAYYKGLQDGQNFSLNEILELEAENERAKELQAGQEEAGRVQEVSEEAQEHSE